MTINQINTEEPGTAYSYKEELIKRSLSMLNDGIKEYLIPKTSLKGGLKGMKYRNEYEMLYIIVFGCSTKKWKMQNQQLAIDSKTMLDNATIDQLQLYYLLVEEDVRLMKEGYTTKERKQALQEVAKGLTDFD